jgi:phospholipid/cholesterol/gamma-HCH transport system substrate-binding protein
MKRSSFITWDQLKVGGVILAALAVLGIAVYKLGQAANLFSRRYTLIAYLPNATGLRTGGTVLVAGQFAGTIKSIDFLPIDNDTTRNLKLVLAIDEELQSQIRTNSKAKVRTLGLLGDKVIDISIGTPRYAILKPNDTISVAQSLDYEAVLAQAAGAVNDMVDLTHDLRQITGGIVAGRGTIGQLMTNRALYDQFIGTMTRANAMLGRFQNPNGTFAKMLDDPTLYNRFVGVITSADSLVVSLNNPNGTVGKFLRDDSVYVHVVNMARFADSLTKMLADPNGNIGKLLTDQTLYDRLTKLTTDAQSIIEDVRKNPQKYTRGAICVLCRK